MELRVGGEGSGDGRERPFESRVGRGFHTVRVGPERKPLGAVTDHAFGIALLNGARDAIGIHKKMLIHV
jgi:hypothetical protein